MAQSGKHDKKQEKKTKKKGSAGKAVAIFVVFIAVLLAGGAYFYYYLSRPEPETWTDAFTASAEYDVPVYIIKGTEEDEDFVMTVTEKGLLTRGTRVRRLDGSEVEIDGVTYAVIDSTGLILKGETADTAAGDTAAAPSEDAEPEEEPLLYMKTENLTASASDAVKETEVYVRTPVTIYAEETGPAIASFAPKGSCLKVTGCDRLLEDGSVYKYKVEYGEGDDAAEGYVYRKYVVRTQKEADKVFNKVFKK